MADFLDLVQRYLQTRLHRNGDYVQTKCPFHKEGRERRPSFSFNTKFGTFKCFACGEHGTSKDFLEKLGVPASLVATEMDILRPLIAQNSEERKVVVQQSVVGDPLRAPYDLPKFQILGVYNWMPTILVDAGFDAQLLWKVGVGYDRSLNRITYPLFDYYGNLAGVVGGATPWSYQEPKYLVYRGGRMVSGYPVAGDYGPWFDGQFPGFECRNHDYLFNYPGALADAHDNPTSQTVVLVEGFKACLWTVQAGFPRTVALMGTYLSDKQLMLLHRLGSEAVLFFDNDDGGRGATDRVANRLMRELHGRVKVVQYPTGDRDKSTQPDSYLAENVRRMVDSAIPVAQWRLPRREP